MKTFELGGFKFRCRVETDPYPELPWQKYDGCGIVKQTEPSERRAPKRAGVIRLHGFGVYWDYDWAATVKKAKAEGWGLTDEDKAKLAAKLGREPTAKQVREEAVRRDFERTKGFLQERWHYVDVSVQRLNDMGHCSGVWSYRGSFESDDLEGIEEAYKELAEQINYDDPYPQPYMVAWTGGTKPGKYGEITEKERKLCGRIFRWHVAVSKRAWGSVDTDTCRTFWRWARYDAHATIRAEDNAVH